MTTGICYNPDGPPFMDPASQPCDQYTNVFSICCGNNHTGGVAIDICEPNSLCLGEFLGPNNTYRGPAYTRKGCTDRTWLSPNGLRNLCTDPSVGT